MTKRKRKKPSKPHLPQKSNHPQDLKKADLVGGYHHIEQHYRGPLPPPAYLDGYEKTLPGCANRIVVMAEDLAKHEQVQEKRLIDIQEADVKRGQWLVFTLAVLCILLAALLYFYTGNIYSGGIFLSAGVLFILGRAFGKVIQYLLGGIMHRKTPTEKDNDNQ